jgi:hypothetical protein
MEEATVAPPPAMEGAMEATTVEVLGMEKESMEALAIEAGGSRLCAWEALLVCYKELPEINLSFCIKD